MAELYLPRRSSECVLAAMIAPETQDRELGLWPAIATLLVAGLLSSFVSAMLLAPMTSALAASERTGSLTLLYQMLVGAVLTALALPYALRAVTDFDIATSAAFVVTLGGALVSLAATMLFAPGGVAMSFLPLVVSVAVEYQLLKRFAHARRVTRPPLAVEAELAYASASPSLPADVEHAAARVRLVVASLSQAEAVDVPRRVQEGLDELQEAAAGLESERELDAPRRLLVAGIRQFQGELVELAEAAWRGDHRSAINRLRGVQTIENALSQLG